MLRLVTYSRCCIAFLQTKTRSRSWFSSVRLPGLWNLRLSDALGGKEANKESFIWRSQDIGMVQHGSTQGLQVGQILQTAYQSALSRVVSGGFPRDSFEPLGKTSRTRTRSLKAGRMVPPQNLLGLFKLLGEKKLKPPIRPHLRLPTKASANTLAQARSSHGWAWQWP